MEYSGGLVIFSCTLIFAKNSVIHWVDYNPNEYQCLLRIKTLLLNGITPKCRTHQSPRQTNRRTDKSLTLRADDARCKLSCWLVAVDGSVTLTLAERHLIASALDAAQHHLCHIAAIPVPGFLGVEVVWIRGDSQLVRWAHASLYSPSQNQWEVLKKLITSADK